MSFVEVFPVEPVIGDDRCAAGAELAAPLARQRLEARREGRGARGPHPGGRRSGGPGVLTRDQHTPCARLQGLAGVAAPVRALTAQPEEQVSGARAARVDRRPRGPSGEAGLRCTPATGRAGEPLEVPAPHAAPAPTGRSCRAASASRATATSSNGILRPPVNSCPCSCPLPATTSTSRGAALATAWAIASRRSASATTPVRVPAAARHDLGDDRVGVLGAGVVRGDEDEVGEPRPDLAHQRPLAAVAVAPGAEHADQPRRAAGPRSISSRAAPSTFSSESGVCA